MSKQQVEVQSVIQSIAEEQVLFLKNRYKMEAAEIVSLYTGEQISKATYGDAIRSIMLFNMQNAQRHGFIAS
jgi:ferredoxin-fold anticodon binding domain-containing protein